MSTDHPLSGGPQLPAAEALSKVSQFFDHEWPETNASEVTVKRIAIGYGSHVHVVRRSSKSYREPDVVILRTTRESFAQERDPWFLTPAEWNLVFYAQSCAGIGPKLLGLSSDCRVEEYIDGDPLHPSQCKDPAIMAEIAAALVRFHHLELPLQKKKFDTIVPKFVSDWQALREQRHNLVQLVRNIDYKDAEYVATKMFDIDFGEEMKWILSLNLRHGSIRATNHTDTNMFNVIIKKDVNAEHRAVLVDFEVVMTGFRGHDIGGHFFEQMILINQNHTKLSGAPYPNFGQREAFCGLYLQALRDRGYQLGPSDTVSHLMLEADIGALFHAMFLGLMIIKYTKLVVLEPCMLSYARLCLDMYPILRTDFVEKYGE